MKVTDEIKYTVLAQYYGQEAKLTRTNGTVYIGKHPELRSCHNNSSTKSYKLILKPLYSITDEEATRIGEILGITEPLGYSDVERCRLMEGRKLIKRHGFLHNISVYQYLQSRGYDLPHFLLGGKTLKEAGIALRKIKK